MKWITCIIVLISMSSLKPMEERDVTNTQLSTVEALLQLRNKHPLEKEKKEFDSFLQEYFEKNNPLHNHQEPLSERITSVKKILSITNASENPLIASRHMSAHIIQTLRDENAKHIMTELHKIPRDQDRQAFLNTELLSKCEEGYTAYAETLILCGANPSYVHENYTSPLLQAIIHGHAPCVTMLLRYKADANPTLWDHISPLFYAAQSGNEEMVHTLLQSGARCNEMRKHWWAKNGFSCFCNSFDDVAHLCLKNGHYKITRLFVDRGIQLSIKDKLALLFHEHKKPILLTAAVATAASIYGIYHIYQR